MDEVNVEAPAAPPRPRRWPGRVALGFGLALPLAVGAGILLATSDLFAAATGVAYGALACSAFAILLGLVAIVGGWGRGAGIAALALGILANPLVLLYGLRAVEGR